MPLPSAHASMANAIRALAMDAVEAAKSGHSGLPLGAADVATVLFSKHLRFDPAAPQWPDRDRFVLSAGHGSMLLYALLHLLGYPGMSLDEVKRFRQWGSKTPGHPEWGHTAGVEMTTGPLGQGIATSVGMAIAETMLAAEFGAGLVDHHTYVLASDGDLMEGVSQEAIALAGHLKLEKLIVLWDDNRISIDGPLSLSDSTDQIARFTASGWNTLAIDGHDPDAIDAAITAAKASDRPTLIACRTIIGYGAPNRAGTAKAHGGPHGAEEVAGTKAALGLPSAAFEVPEGARAAWADVAKERAGAHHAWLQRLAAADPAKRAEFERRQSGVLPSDIAAAFEAVKAKAAASGDAVATRKSSEIVLDAITPAMRELVGGSADLSESNLTKTKATPTFSRDARAGRFVNYGIREHAMAAAMNGMALHGGVRPYSGTFLVFSDYCRPSLRLAALMGLPVIHVMTHDSIGVGEDGPTHQPVEHVASLRAIPNLLVFRPCDTLETAEAYQAVLGERRRPAVLAFSRQAAPPSRRTYTAENLAARGAYELAAADGPAEVALFASGTEVAIALEAKAKLDAAGHPARVVSVPCFELFAEQDADYRAATIGDAPVKIAIEAGIGMGWERFIGVDGVFIGMSGFGASAPFKDLYSQFGITAAHAVEAALNHPNCKQKA